MTAAAAAWPGSRHLLAWWRDLADVRPRRLWAACLPLHRVEALASVTRRTPLDPLRRAFLHSLSLPSAEGETPWTPLHLDRQVYGQLLHALTREGLADAAGDRGALTAAGRRALAEGAVAATTWERRAFPFLDRPGDTPHFLPVYPASGPAPAGEAAPFDPAVLATCVSRSAEWKARWGFPAEVESILLPTGQANGVPPDWRRVVLDHNEDRPMVLVELPPGAEKAAGPRLVGFAVQMPGWVLRPEAVVVELGEGWEEAFGALLRGPSAEEWKRTWQAWCQPRGLPPAEVEACALELNGTLLRVRAPQRLVDRLRATRSDAVKQEAWLLAGTGRARAAARIDLVEGAAGK